MPCHRSRSQLDHESSGRFHPQKHSPDVFFKKTMLSSIRDEVMQKERQLKKTINVGEYGHMMHKKLQKTPSKQTLEQLKFYGELRNDKNKLSKNGTTSSKQFDHLPYKDKHNYPQFIKKDHMNKVNVRKSQLESAFDGAQNQQPYSNKMKTRNYAMYEPMTRVRGRNRVELPSLAWEMGLRSY